MKRSQNLYSELTDQQKKQLIKHLYLEENKSFYDIADQYGTYANKIRRDAKSFNIPIRNKSEAQKNALQIGKHKHPTKGKQRDQKTKDKIGRSVLDSWTNLNEEEILDRKKTAKKQWESLSDDHKQNMLKLANDAVRKSSKTGSKLEKFLLNKLISDGYKVDFHKEQTLSNTKLQIDLFLPKIDTAIEVDGPSHFLPVWGEDALKKNKTYDQKKEGLILGKGWKLIRIKQKKDFSKTRSNIVYDNLISILEIIKKDKTSDQVYTIEDNNE